uniref:Uncharacterized protein n=1 Tax=Acrobeloides nanus TaxID=290746 RepID=A0A914D6R7_9BILA
MAKTILNPSDAEMDETIGETIQEFGEKMAEGPHLMTTFTIPKSLAYPTHHVTKDEYSLKIPGINSKQGGIMDLLMEKFLKMNMPKILPQPRMIDEKSMYIPVKLSLPLPPVLLKKEIIEEKNDAPRILPQSRVSQTMHTQENLLESSGQDLEGSGQESTNVELHYL